MSEDNDGGPAFPGGELRFDDADCTTPYYAGMSLRDWFAGQALAGMMASNDAVPVGTLDPRGLLASSAYAMADAMLKARKP